MVELMMEHAFQGWWIRGCQTGTRRGSYYTVAYNKDANAHYQGNMMLRGHECHTKCDSIEDAYKLRAYHDAKADECEASAYDGHAAADADCEGQ